MADQIKRTKSQKKDTQKSVPGKSHLVSPNPTRGDDKLSNAFGSLWGHVDNTRNQCISGRREGVGELNGQ